MTNASDVISADAKRSEPQRKVRLLEGKLSESYESSGGPDSAGMKASWLYPPSAVGIESNSDKVSESSTV